MVRRAILISTMLTAYCLAQATDKLEIISLSPASPAVLEAEQRVMVKVKYQVGSVEGARIFVRPYAKGKRTRGYGAHPSPQYESIGEMEGWFEFSDAAQVDEIRVDMRSPDNKLLAQASLSVGLVWKTDGATSEMPDQQAILDLIPRISLEEEGISSYLVEGTLRLDGQALDFIVVGKEPDHVSVTLTDGRDGTPLMVGVDNVFMVYDPFVPQVLTGSHIPKFDFYMEKAAGKEGKTENHFWARFSVVPRPKGEEENRSLKRGVVNVDVGSILDVENGQWNIYLKGAGVYVAEVGSERGNKAVVTVDPSRTEGALSQFELIPAGQTEPVVILRRIELNQALPEQYFKFPKQELLESSLPLVEYATDAEIRMESMIGCLVRFAMQPDVDVSLREKLEDMVDGEFDWNIILEKDKENSGILRDLFKYTVEPTQKTRTSDGSGGIEIKGGDGARIQS